MTNKIQVMIADEDRDFAHLVQQTLLANHCFSICSVFRTGRGLIDAIRRDKPDVLLMDLMLPGTNGLTILQQLQTLPADCIPSIFVVSSFASVETSAECERLGVSFFLRKPIDVSSLASLICRYSSAAAHQPLCAEPQPAIVNLSLRITHILNSMHFPAHVMGYRYLRDAILMTLEDPCSADSVTKILYPAIAKKHHTTWTSVERDIRNAISLAWDRSSGNFRGFSSMRHATNREFILTIADHIQFELHPHSSGTEFQVQERFG